MKSRYWLWLLAGIPTLVTTALAQAVSFDFDDAPIRSPLPVTLVAGGITGQFSSSTPIYNYSIQPADTLGFTPVGFSGLCIYPSTVFKSDLLVSFDQTLLGASLMYAPEEYATDTSCTMRITGFLGASQVATNTFQIKSDQPGTWPTGILSLTSALPFDRIVIHYDSPPPTGGDYGPIFMVDHLVVTPVPEPAVSGAFASALILGLNSRRRNSYF